MVSVLLSSLINIVGNIPGNIGGNFPHYPVSSEEGKGAWHSLLCMHLIYYAARCKMMLLHFGGCTLVTMTQRLTVKTVEP